MMITKHSVVEHQRLDDGDTRALFDAVRTGMKMKKKKEAAEMWEIAPKCDPKGFRDNYVKGTFISW